MPCVSLNGRRYFTVKDRINPRYKPSFESTSDCKRSFNVGDAVRALNLGRGPKWYPGKVVKKLGSNVYIVFIPELDVTWKRHVNQMLFGMESNDAYEPILPFAPNSRQSLSLSSQADDALVLPRRSTRVSQPVQRYGYD